MHSYRRPSAELKYIHMPSSETPDSQTAEFKTEVHADFALGDVGDKLKLGEY
jgi:hypothetical protein